MMGFKYIEERDLFECETCGAEVQRGITNISGHWAECTGKEKMDYINKLANSTLATKDKMELLKKEFGIEQ